MPDPVRVGVIGLGPRWRGRYRPALRGLRDCFRVTAVCDQCHERAVRQARHLKCAAAGGPVDLLQRPQVDALLLLDPQWYGLWPLGVACRAGKPVLFCPPDGAEPDAANLAAQARAGGILMVAALTLRLSPAADRLRQLLRATLGPARLVLYAGSSTQGPGLLDLLDWCGELLEGSPQRTHERAAPGLTSLVLEYDNGRAAQLTRYLSACPHPPPRLEVMAERGSASVRLPDLLTWADAAGRHAQRLPRAAPPERLLLERFHHAITRGEPLGPGLEDVERLLCRTAGEPGA